VRTIDGAPGGGLPYRLIARTSATQERPDRLVIWLHPAGPPSDDLVNAMAPVFTRRGFALLIPASRNTNGWSDADAVRLMSWTLPEVATIPLVNASRPILLGFSGGGQLALALWRAGPGRYAGLILDAAYPLDERDGKQMVMDLPSDAAVRSVPMLVLVGALDPVAPVWDKVEAAWRAAGVPLTVRRVPGKGHEWLFGEVERAALGEWLETASVVAR